MRLVDAINNCTSFGNEHLAVYSSEDYIYYVEELINQLDKNAVLYFNGDFLSLDESNLKSVSHGLPINVMISVGLEHVRIGGFYNSWDTTHFLPAVEVKPALSVTYLSESEFEARGLTWPTDM